MSEVDPKDLDNARIVAEAFAMIFDKRAGVVCEEQGGKAALAKSTANILCAMIENDLLCVEAEEEEED